MTAYTNPRLEAKIENWPLGHSKRGPAHFHIETDPKRGQRAVRTTFGAPKKLTYASKTRIVDGDDGHIYIVHLTVFGSISVMKSDMKLQHEWISEENPRYAELLALFD